MAVSFGNTAITQSDLETEYRFELLLDGKSPTGKPDRATLEQVRERLTQQKLLAMETETDAVDPSSLQKAALDALAEVQKRFSSQQAFGAALGELGLTEEQVLDRLAEQQRTLRMIDQRLRPSAAPGSAEVETYYEEMFVPEYTRRNAGPVPALAEVENEIREILVQKRIDELLASWMEELKASRRVRFHPL